MAVAGLVDQIAVVMPDVPFLCHYRVATEITDAAPVPEWVYFLGKFVGLGLVLVALQALMMAAGMLIQVLLGHFDFQIGLYARILFGLQLPDYLLFALLALVVHALVNHK